MNQLVSYRRDSSGPWVAGILVDRDVADAASALGGPLGLSVKAMLRDGLVDRAISGLADAQRFQLEEVELGPPVPDAGKVICVGLNYRDHAAESNLQLPTAPVLFAKFATSLSGPLADIELPAESTMVDYEGELAIVIGRRCRRVPAEASLEYIAGYSAFNDLTARDLQFAVSQWTAGKAIDGFGPMGPGVALTADVGDPQALRLTTKLNGDTVQAASTDQMIFSVAELVSYISRLITLEPGDIIATGTPAGVGQSRTPPLFLKPGDNIEVDIQGVGTIRNRMVTRQ